MFIRILYLHQYFNTPAMASSTRSYEMGRRLVKYGHEVNIITSYRPGNRVGEQGWFKTVEEGMNVHWLPVPYSNMMSYRERIIAFMKFAWKASAKAASIDCDVVFATSTPLTIALPAVYASKKQKVPMVFEIRDLWPELPIAVGALKNPLAVKAAKWLEKFAYNNSESIIALSPGMKEGIIKTGYPVDKVEIIPNSCDLSFFKVDPEKGKELRRQYEWIQDRPLVIYTGTLGVINGVDYLARLAGAVWKLDQEVRFLVIGEGKEETKVATEARKEGVLNKNFFMMPKIAKHNIPKWLLAADLATSIFIDLEAMWANSANKFFDALASGTPIAINYGGWQADLIRETGAGLVFDPIDVNLTANLLVEKIRDTEWLESAGVSARKLAVDRFDRDKLAKKFEQILDRAVRS